MRAPIFYDSNNTAFFTDPASTSNLNGLTVAATITGSVSGTAGSIAGFNNPTTAATANAIVYRDGNGDDFRRYGFAQYFNMSHGVSTRSSETVFFSSTDAYIRKNDATGMRASLNVPTRTGGDASGTWGISITGNAGTVTNPTFAGDSTNRANITTRVDSGFYEHDTVTTAEGWPQNDSSWMHMIAATHSNDANYFSMQIAADFFANDIYYRSVNNSGGAAWNRFALYNNNFSGDLYANIFYDSQNTAYYVDPNSTSVLTRLGVSNQFEYPGSMNADYNSGYYHFSNTQNTPTGAFGHAHIIRLSGDWNVQQFWGTGSDWDFWFRKRLNGTNNQWHFIMTSTLSRWNTTSEGRNRFFFASNGRTYFGSGDGYEFRSAADSNIGTISNTGVWQATGDMRAPIFYDSANTGRFLDPGGSTSLSLAGSITMDGAITAGGNITAFSDIRIKDNIEEIQDALSRISHIRGVTYTRTDLANKDRRNGALIAQEVEQVLPEAVFDTGKTKSIDYYATIGLLVEAIKELKAEIDELKSR
jgi:hypothetical protein